MGGGWAGDGGGGVRNGVERWHGSVGGARGGRGMAAGGGGGREVRRRERRGCRGAGRHAYVKPRKVRAVQYFATLEIEASVSLSQPL